MEPWVRWSWAFDSQPFWVWDTSAFTSHSSCWFPQCSWRRCCWLSGINLHDLRHESLVSRGVPARASLAADQVSDLVFHLWTHCQRCDRDSFELGTQRPHQPVRDYYFL